MAAATFACALLLTVAAGAIAGRAESARRADTLRLTADEMAVRLETRFDAYVSVLRATRGLFAAADDIDPDAFARFAGALRLQERLPGIQGLGWSQRIPADHRDTFVADVRARIWPDFRLWPEGERDEHHAILMLEPRDERNRAAIGFDMRSEPVRREAMDRARDSGEAALSGPVLLVQEITEDKQSGFLIYLPVYAQGRPLRTVGERRLALLGFAYAPFRAFDLLRTVFGDRPPLAFVLRDGPTGEPLFASTTPPTSAPAARRDLVIAGRSWRLEFAAPAGDGPRLMWSIIAGGAVVAAVLAIGAWLLARARIAAERAAAGLRQSEAALRDREGRLRFLGEASAALSASLEHEQTLAALARMAVPALADWCAIDLVDGDGRPRRLVVVHADPRRVALAEELRRRWPPQPGDTVSRVIASGTPVLVETITDEQLRSAQRDPEHLRLLRGLGLRSAILVPLTVRGRVLGVLTLVTAESRRGYGAADLAFAEELAQRAAVAVENAALYEGERAARGAAEHARQRLAQQAEELQRSNAELEQFAYVASHDMQEPLRMISSYLDLLDRRLGPQLDANARGWLSYAVQGARRMQELIKDLLGYSRAGRDRGEPGPVDATRALAEALENLQGALADARAQVEHGPLPVIRFDKLQLVQLFQNLIGNAIKFRGSGPPRVRIEAERDGARWRIAVRDNGIGIAAGHQQRIFDIFQRLHSRDEYPGTGIGLAICKRIVERHGGAIWVEPAPGGGSVFRFTVPADGPS